MKKLNVTSIITAALIAASGLMVTVPTMASNTNYGFEFNFEYGNIETTDVEYKSTDRAITTYCTWEEGTSGSTYAVKACGVASGKCSDEYNLCEGRKKVFYATGIIDEGVYLQARLNSYDVDTFSGYWNPDDPDYP